VVSVFKPSDNQFKVHWDQTTTLRLGARTPITFTNSFESDAYPTALPSPAMTNQFERHESMAPPSPNRFDILDVTTNDANFQVTIQINNLKVSLESDPAEVVDATEVPFAFSSAVVPIVHAGMARQLLPINAPTSYQVSDPRLNWLATSWTTNAPTMGSANSGQEDKRIHASNSGFLYSPLELGHLLMPRNSAPGPVWHAWDTLHVFNEGGWRDPLLETFTTDPNAGSVRNGLVNPNTIDPLVLATAFRELPSPVVGGPVLSDANVVAIQDLFYSAQTNGTTFSSIIDVLDLDWVAGLPDMSEPERDAVAAYSTGLMGVRQNLFLIIVSASAASEGMGANESGRVGWRGRQRAVALLWRDPVANAQGLHDCYIRMFKWLN
jgi:hypothetical protein